MTALNRLSIRTPVVVAVLATASFGGLLALEKVAPADGPRTSVIDVDLKSHNDAGASAQHEKHCTDGKGKDGEKNKHCRPVSGHQG